MATSEAFNNKIKLEEFESRFKKLEKRVEENKRIIDMAISKYGIRA